MAEAFAKRLGFMASSAGTIPSTRVNSLVVQAMNEVGIDVSQSKPKNLTAEMIEEADLVVLTDGSLEKAIPRDLMKKMRKKYVQWSMADPQGMDIVEIRFVRDQIESAVGRLAKSNDS